MHFVLPENICTPLGRSLEILRGGGGGGGVQTIKLGMGVLGILMEQHNVNILIILLVHVPPLYKILELISKLLSW